MVKDTPAVEYEAVKTEEHVSDRTRSVSLTGWRHSRRLGHAFVDLLPVKGLELVPFCDQCLLMSVSYLGRGIT